jgi:hypothetical protein
MSQKPVVTIEDITNIALDERRPGCEKGMLHEDAPVQTSVYRVKPGSGRKTSSRRQFCGTKQIAVTGWPISGSGRSSIH